MFGIKQGKDQFCLDTKLNYWADQFVNFRHNTVHKVNSVQKQLKELEAEHEELVQKVASLTQPEPAESDKFKDTKIAQQAARIAQLEKALVVMRDERDDLAKAVKLQRDRAEAHKSRYYELLYAGRR